MNAAFLKLEIDGNDIEGDSTMTSLDRENTIECRGYAAHSKKGRIKIGDVTITKPVDRSSTYLAKAMANNEPVKAEFMFYRPEPSGGGAEELFYRVTFDNGSVVRIRQHVEMPFDTPSPTAELLEDVRFQFTKAEYTHEVTGGWFELVNARII